jgi:homoserine kinase type II
MAVYTPINKSELDTWLANFSIGLLKNFKGISSGVTNTNYLVETESSRFILTIFEHNQLKELLFFFDLMNFLSDKNFSCPQPIVNNNGSYLTPLKGKPAALVSFLIGSAKDSGTESDCYSVGLTLGRLHTQAKNFTQTRDNNRGIAWISSKYNDLKPFLSVADRRIIELEIDYQKNCYHDSLPTGIIHGDLFRDNVFFDKNGVSAFIDFYYACNDQLLLDIAITINDWCSDSNGCIDKRKFDNFLSGYESIRKLENSEHKCINNAMRFAALRFWLSRLDACHNILDGEITSIKDPNYFKKVLMDRHAL